LTIAFALWAAATVIVRGCGSDASIPLRYASYFCLNVLLPGVVVLQAATSRRLSVPTIVALGVPLGFAVEIFTFLGLSALHLRSLTALAPVAWITLGAGLWLWRRAKAADARAGEEPQRPTDRAPFTLSMWITATALSLLFLFTVVVAASFMYAESPLVHGWPQRPLFHDWVYLLSRAAVIKEHWPLEEPSLAGTPLQYHYFLLVHVAAAATSTGVDVTWILLRLAVIPLGLVLLCQAYVLGRRVEGSRFAGVVAALLVLTAGEVSLTGDHSHPVFLGFFLRWLYVSPTFFFGVIFFGALLVAVPDCEKRVVSPVLLVLLAAAATGAKGSVMPVLLIALVGWLAWTWVVQRRWPSSVAIAFVLLAAAFGIVYLATLSQWGAAGVEIRACAIGNITEFWNSWAVPCERWLKRALHAPAFGTWLGAALVFPGLVAGTAGIAALGLFQPRFASSATTRSTARWLVAAALAAFGFGFFCHFDSNDELYFVLLSRLPFSALGGAFLATVLRRAAFGFALRRGSPGKDAGSAGALTARVTTFSGWRTVAYAGGGIGLAAILIVQLINTGHSLRPGWLDWQRRGTVAAVTPDLVPLCETMDWIRRHTERDAVLIANAFSVKTIPHGRGVRVDDTTVGVHYYYSALSGRRVWVEGPTYLLDQAEARRRLCEVTGFFARHRRPSPDFFANGPAYILIDHRIPDGLSLTLPRQARVYSNDRYDVFRLRAFDPAALRGTMITMVHP
jgi:hypothetical protein